MLCIFLWQVKNKVALVECKLRVGGSMWVHLKPYDTSHMSAGISHRFIDAFQTDMMPILWL